MTVIVYTDASYCHLTDIAACGYCVLLGDKLIKHEVLLVSGLKGSSSAEIYSFTHALQFCFLLKGVTKIIAHTDHKPIVMRRKKKMIFKELNETIDIITEHGIELSVNHVKAHRSDRYNNLVDKNCLYILRDYIRAKHLKNKVA